MEASSGKENQNDPLLPTNNIELQEKSDRELSLPDQDRIFLNGIDRSPVELKPPKKVKTIDKFFDTIGYSKYQYIQILIAVVVNVVIGVESLIPNLIVVQIQREMHIELYVAAMLVAAFGLGAGVGKYRLFKNFSNSLN